MRQTKVNKSQSPRPPAPSEASGWFWPVALGLALATLATYWPARLGGLLNIDDDGYVLFPMVSKGLRSAAVVWAFTSVHVSNWHPLTSLSHMLDVQLFGLNPAPMHWENIVLHIVNSVLVLIVWRAFTGAFWRSAMVAALFALHPLHVESVAWISERKDVTSTLFWLLGLWTYLGWVRRRTAARYALVAAALVVSLLFKPMAVTFPCTLLLLDAWPLRRWPAEPARKLVVEKASAFRGGCDAQHRDPARATCSRRWPVRGADSVRRSVG